MEHSNKRLQETNGCMTVLKILNIFDAPLSSWAFHMMESAALANHNRRMRPHCAGVAGGEPPGAETGHDSLRMNQSEGGYYELS
jgi:hypothetical protein